MDAQLPPALARWLRDAGCEAEHVEDAGLSGAADAAIWAQALRTESIIVTKDEDFAARSAQAKTGPVVVWLRVGNTTNRALLEWFAARWPGIARLLEQGGRLVEVI